MKLYYRETDFDGNVGESVPIKESDPWEFYDLDVELPKSREPTNYELRLLNASNRIASDLVKNKISNHMDRCLELLGIKMGYKEFLGDIGNAHNKKRVKE